MAVLATGATGALALTDILTLQARRAAIAGFADRAALAAARSPADPEGAANAALGTDAESVRLAVDVGRFRPMAGTAADRFEPLETGAAVRVAVSARTSLPVSGLLGVHPLVSAEAFALREGIAGVAIVAGRSAAAGPVPDAVAAAVAGRPVPLADIAAASSAGLTVSPARLSAGLADRADPGDGTVSLADAFRAAAEAADPEAVRDRDLWLSVAEALADSSAVVRPADLTATVPSATDVHAAPAPIPAADLAAMLLRSAALDRATIVDLTAPTEGIERIVVEIRGVSGRPAVLVGAEADGAAIPPVTLAVRATLSGSVLPGLGALDLPLVVEIQGGSAVVDAVDCASGDPAGSRVDVAAQPVQARARFGDATTSAGTAPVPLAETGPFSAWIRGDTGAATEPATPLSFPPGQAGRAQRVSAALALEDVVRRLVAEAEVVVTVRDDGAVTGAAVRDEIGALLADHAPALSGVIGEVLATLGIVPGEIAVTAAGLSCTGARLVR